MSPLLRPCAAATALLAVLTGCSALGIGADTLEAGDAIRAAEEVPAPGTPAADGGWSAELQLPDGLLTVRVAPLDDREVAAQDAFTGDAAEVDDGASLVAVSWSEETGAGVPEAVRSLVLDAGGVDDDLALVDGDRRISLEVDGLSRTGGFVYAAVGDVDGLAVEMVFDGVAQSVTADADAPQVDEAARALYAGAPGSPDRTDCLDSVTPASLERDGVASCRVRSAAWPWLVDGGWSDGDPWQVVGLETTLGLASGDDVSDTEVTATVDGTAPVSEADQGGDELSTSSLLVFAPGGTDLQVQRTSTVAGASASLTGSATLD